MPPGCCAYPGQLSFAPSLNISGLTGGYAGDGVKTVAPARAAAGLDFRLVPEQDPAAVERTLRDRLDGLDDVRVTVLAAARLETTPIDHPLVRRVAAASARAAGREPLLMPLVPDRCRWSRHRASMRPCPACHRRPTRSTRARAHAPDEHIRLEDIPKAVRMTRALLRSLAGGEG